MSTGSLTDRAENPTGTVIRVDNDEIGRLTMAIEWLCEAAAAAGSPTVPTRLFGKERVAAAAAVDQIRETIHPRKLPADIDWFWTTWNPHSFGLLTGHPRLTDAAFALKTWLDSPDWPRALFWVAYESHCFLAVELDYPGSPGPQVYYDCYASGEGLHLVAPDLATWLSAAAATLESGEFEDYGDGHVTPPDSSMKIRCTEALDVRGIGLHERGPFDWYDVLACPERWQLQQGVDQSSLTLRGATSTIADVHQARLQGPVEATIVGQRRVRAGSGGGRLVTVVDATGSIEVWIPSGVPSLETGGDVYEFDIAASRLDRPDVSMDDFRADHDEATRRALAGDGEDASEAALNMAHFISREHPIVAIAVRPI